MVSEQKEEHQANGASCDVCSSQGLQLAGPVSL